MPVVGLALDELFRYLGRSLAPDALEHELHRFGCSVEGWANVVRYRCPHCGAVVEAPEFEAVPPLCDSCGGDLRLAGLDVPELGRVHVLRMELLAVRPDLFDAPGLARALRGFLGVELGAPRYSLAPGEHVIEVEPGVAAVRSRIAAATVHGVAFDDASLRSLMKLQENIHWALGRDRKLASIGVYDLARVSGPALRYRAVGRDALRFVPLGYDPQAADSAMTPHEILERHPKGRAFAWLLPGSEPVPLLEDSRGGVLSMPPIINSEATRVTRETTDVLIDVTGHSDRHVERALAIVVASLLETCPGARARTVAIRYEHETRITPDFTPQPVPVEPREAARLIGVPWSRETVVDLLRRMRHDVRDEGGPLTVLVPA
ncbi:MAG: hypothetical protein HC882_08385, partial [Acidobacteria bacterium]|nr:hypothetical protein [Acidobacteriota bacterium]